MNPIVRLVADALPGERRYVLLAGAGVSKDAGVPTAWDLMLKTASLLYAVDHPDGHDRVDLERWFVGSPYASSSYFELMEQLFPGAAAQQAFLRKFLAGHSVGQAHREIARLAQRGIIRAIVTPNFDPYIEQALQELGLSVQVIASDDDLESSEPLIHCKAVRIYKPHGTLDRGSLKNTPKDLESLSPLFETELRRLFSEHGVLVLGYAGRDPGLMRALSARSASFFQTFWVNPSPPLDSVRTALGDGKYTFIQCEGASQFLRSFFALVDKVAALVPEAGRGPSVPELEAALIAGSPTVRSLFSAFADALVLDLQQIRPTFNDATHIDETVLDQIEKGAPITGRFLNAAQVAITHQNVEALKILYSVFGRIVQLYDVPEGFSGTFRRIDFDGYKFLGYEMLTGLAALAVKAEAWEVLADVLGDDLFVEGRQEGYRSFAVVSQHVESLDQLRKQRLGLRRLSVTADVLKARVESHGDWPVTFQEFAEGEYFLFVRSLCLPERGSVWHPRTSLFLQKPPRFISKSESARYLKRVAAAAGVPAPNDFVNLLAERHSMLTKFFSDGWPDGPLDDFDFSKLGTRP